MSKQRRRGNELERNVAKALGGDRVGHYGGTDVVTEHWAVECKSRQTVPKWLTDAVAQAARHAGDGQTPLAVVHQLGARHDDDLVVMRRADFIEWFGAIQKGQDNAQDQA